MFYIGDVVNMNWTTNKDDTSENNSEERNEEQKGTFIHLPWSPWSINVAAMSSLYAFRELKFHFNKNPT